MLLPDRLKQSKVDSIQSELNQLDIGLVTKIEDFGVTRKKLTIIVDLSITDGSILQLGALIGGIITNNL
jgi:hypothetical protein